MMRQDETSHEKLRSAVETIRRKFIEELDERILDMEALKQMVVNGDRSQDALEEIIRRAHKIRGVAATLGLEGLGEAAGKLEDCYMELFQSSRSHVMSFAESWSVIASLVEALLDEMERALEA